MPITKSLAKSLTNYGNQKSLGSQLRAKRIGPLLTLIEKVFSEHGSVNIIDIGGTAQYWGIVDPSNFEKFKIRITIANLPNVNLPDNYGPFTFIHGDACDLHTFKNNSFHIAHSNSVIEHVGDWSRMIKFANELKRVAKYYFVQTPNYWFPIEPHCMTPFFHWLPKPMRIKLVMSFALGHWEKASSISEAVYIVESARLLNRKMFFSLFENSKFYTERFYFMPKSFIAMHDQ